MPERARIGDRLENAIEERAHVEEAIARGDAAARESPPGRLRRTVFWVALTGISLYLVAPSIVEVLGSWKDVEKLAPGWLVVMLVAQTAAMASLWALQRLAIHTKPWSPVITSQLAGNALAKVAPGGGAIGAALQYRMLVDAGLQRPPVVSGLTAANLLTFAVVMAMPVLAIPALLRGGVDRGLLEAAVIGLALFVALAIAATLLVAFDGPLAWLGRTIQRVRNRLRRGSDPLTRLPDRLLAERNRMIGTLGPRWKRALVATVGRWSFDYATLLAALAAVGDHARPGLVLLAFCAAQLLAQIPVTPGGLGFVETGLTAMLTLAGIGAGAAVLATFAYRLASYWLPLPVGLAAWAVHRRRYANP
ncbi:MAG: lysylphosphatidylglycerol synthase transmembrane domain-containing protein [Thermoleophilaceae bacterium]